MKKVMLVNPQKDPVVFADVRSEIAFFRAIISMALEDLTLPTSHFDYSMSHLFFFDEDAEWVAHRQFICDMANISYKALYKRALEVKTTKKYRSRLYESRKTIKKSKEVL